MTIASRHFVLFDTDLFVVNQSDDDADRWFVGGDCAGWFYARLLPADQIDPYLEPVMEDWGWTFAVTVDGVRVWVNVWKFDDPNRWLFGVEARKRLFRRHTKETLERAQDIVCDASETILASDRRFSKYAWFAENPFDLGRKNNT